MSMVFELEVLPDESLIMSGTFNTPFPRVEWVPSLNAAAGKDVMALSQADLRHLGERVGVNSVATLSRPKLLDEIFQALVEVHLDTPTFVIDYPGTPGWYSIDTKNSGVRSDGYDRIVVQHRTKSGGPYFSVDGSAQTTPYGSYLLNPFVNNSLGGPGNYYLASGDFLVRASFNYYYKQGNTSMPPPYPSLLDVTKQAGLTTSDGTPRFSGTANCLWCHYPGGQQWG